MTQVSEAAIREVKALSEYMNSEEYRREQMTSEHEEHLQSIKDKVCELIDVKYRIGVAEHGGNLWEKPLAFFEKEIENEMVDLLVYWVSRPQRLKLLGEIK